jgi:hypothetical protein
VIIGLFVIIIAGFALNYSSAQNEDNHKMKKTTFEPLYGTITNNSTTPGYATAQFAYPDEGSFTGEVKVYLKPGESATAVFRRENTATEADTYTIDVDVISK